ncbi:MAG: asparaginyl/glutamyl-tRNA amidotransferase subunit C [Rhodospirillales bacterium RIFCSPLOWO2_12_FULL_58_28]|nr:MAG: asparaginyl/glutamyl-tRNA amidotransferase subunit C [Rhodospirillales bacterium RIFCSPLOWO2_02_FULL_58_16]OHC78882.1 MAG: asparaginyl/glutamyl-tRNA amidotransferase subunit C [Rhodospirillales bacterium RIFCSPLOWO2_12_FULL_58_28]
MSLDKSAVKTIAMLARIRTPDDELDHLADELSAIIGWVEQLAEVDTDGVEPMTGVCDITLPRRRDEVTDGGKLDQVLANAPEPEGDFFTAPKVIE